VATSISFVPVFHSPEETDEIEILEDQEPELETVYEPESLHFIFVLDRSGSMGYDRMEKAKAALKLFLRSLPEGCTFSVINYGTSSSYLKVGGQNVIEYNEENALDALGQIEKYTSNMGMTNIEAAMKNAINLKSSLNKRVILLTDGAIT